MTEKIPKLVLCDWDGTLVDTLPLIRAAHENVWGARRQGEFTDEMFEHALLMDPRDVFKAFYHDQADDASREFYTFIEENHLRRIKMFAGLETLLSLWHDQKIAAGVVSKKKKEYLLAEIAHLGLTSCFACVVATGDSAREKPFPDPILTALERFPGTDKNDVWYLGDAESDMAASNAAETRSILVLHGKDKTGLIAQYHPSKIFRDLDEVKSFFAPPYPRPE